MQFNVYSRNRMGTCAFECAKDSLDECLTFVRHELSVFPLDCPYSAEYYWIEQFELIDNKFISPEFHDLKEISLFISGRNTASIN